MGNTREEAAAYSVRQPIHTANALDPKIRHAVGEGRLGLPVERVKVGRDHNGEDEYRTRLELTPAPPSGLPIRLEPPASDAAA